MAVANSHWVMFTAYQCRMEASTGHDFDATQELEITLAPEFHDNHSMLYFLNSPLECIRICSSIGPDVGSMQALWALLSNMEPGTDVAEVCGGQGRVLKVCARRRLRTGRNFDLTCNVDLHNAAEKHALWRYIMAGIWVIVMAPPYTPFGSRANYDRWRNADACLATQLQRLRTDRSFVR